MASKGGKKEKRTRENRSGEFSGASAGSLRGFCVVIPVKSRDIPPKSLVSLVSRDIPNFSAPTPSSGRPPPHRRISGPKNLGLGSFFLPDFSSFFSGNR